MPEGNSRIPSFLRAPRFEDEVADERAYLLHWVMSWSFALFGVIGLIIGAASDWSPQVLGVNAVGMLLITAGLILVRRSPTGAGALLTVSGFALQTFSVVANGVGTATIGGYMVVVVLAALFWDGRRAAVIGVAGSAVILALAFGEHVGWLGAHEPRPVLVVAAETVLQILIILTLMGAGLRTLRRSEERVLRAARRHERLIERSPDGILEVDDRGVVGAFNPAAERITGRRAKGVLGHRLWELDLVSTDDAARGRVHFERVWRGEADAPFEVVVLRPDGERVPVELYTRRVVRADGGVGLMATCRDLRARKRAEEERASLEELLHRSRHLESLGRLAGGVAHDFNNLLTVMTTNTQLLLDGQEPGPHWRDDVEQIREAARRASALTQQLLAFARRETLEARVTDINEPLEGMRELMARLSGTEVELVWDLGERLPPVRLDPTRFEQIMLNLITNARDAMPHGGVVTIRTRPFEVDGTDDPQGRSMPEGRYVWLRVKDEGEGMDMHTVGHIFEPFFTTKRGTGGTGLGLATVHGIVAQSGGFVFVESTLGEGTAFDLFFPDADEASASELRRLESRPRTGGRAVILLVEDELISGRITTRVLQERGYEVIWAQGVEEARAVWAERGDEIELLLSDVVMPDGLGPELARELRAEQPTLRVVYISGYDDEALGRTFDSEASGLTLIRKPFSIAALLAQVQVALEDPAPAPHASGGAESLSRSGGAESPSKSGAR